MNPITMALSRWDDLDTSGYFSTVTDADVTKALSSERPTPIEFLTLLSPRADSHLESMAERARELTRRHFGRTIGLYAPLYLSNFCANRCLYCGFSAGNRIARRRLSYGEILRESAALTALGIQHLVVLTGESRSATPFDYLRRALALLTKRFASVSIEMLSLSEDEYRVLALDGVDGVTVYQETYDRSAYSGLHLSGPKADFDARLEIPDRAARAGLRKIVIGPLLGLSEPIKDAFLAGLHASLLQKAHPGSEFGLALPRVTSAEGGFIPPFPLDDATFVRLLLAFRIFLPWMPLSISTRERPEFRDRLLHLGATQFSAGSRTEVGAYALEKQTLPQFAVADDRSPDQFARAVCESGLDPVRKDGVPL